MRTHRRGDLDKAERQGEPGHSEGQGQDYVWGQRAWGRRAGIQPRCLPSSTHRYACQEPHACALTNLSRAGKKPPPPKSVVQVNEGFTLLCGPSPNTFLPHSPTLTPGFHPHLRATLEARARKETHEEDLFVGFRGPGSGLRVTVGSQVLLRRRSRV